MSDGSKKRFGFWGILGVVVLLLAAAAVTAPFLIDVDQFRPELESELTTMIGHDVKVGHLQYSLSSGSVTADEIVVADDLGFGPAPFVRAERLRVGVEWKPLIFSKTLRITDITLERPEITLVRAQSGEWNFSGLAKRSHAARIEEPGRGPSGSNLSIGALRVTDGKITVIRRGSRLKSHVYSQVAITARDLSFTSVFPFRMTAVLPGGGSAALEGKAGPVHHENVVLTPFDSTVGIQRFNLVASGFVEPDLGFGGVIDFKGEITSDGSRVRTRGHANVDKLQVVKSGSPALRPVALDYSLGYDLKSQVGMIDDAAASCDNAVVHLAGRYELHSDSMIVKLKLHGEQLPVSNLESLLPAFGVSLPRGTSLRGGTLSTSLATEGPINHWITSGTVELAGTQLSGFDLGTTMARVASLAGIHPNPNTDIERLASLIRIMPEGNLIKDLILVVPSLGELTGDGVIRSDHSLEFKMTARLKNADGIAGSLVRIAGNSGLAIPFFIRGTATEPSFSADVRGAAEILLDSAKEKGRGATGNAWEALLDLLGKKKK
jgi:AsmA protein